MLTNCRGVWHVYYMCLHMWDMFSDLILTYSTSRASSSCLHLKRTTLWIGTVCTCICARPLTKPSCSVPMTSDTYRQTYAHTCMVKCLLSVYDRLQLILYVFVCTSDSPTHTCTNAHTHTHTHTCSYIHRVCMRSSPHTLFTSMCVCMYVCMYRLTVHCVCYGWFRSVRVPVQTLCVLGVCA